MQTETPDKTELRAQTALSGTVPLFCPVPALFPSQAFRAPALLLALSLLFFFLFPSVSLGAPALKIWNATEESLPPDSEGLSAANERMHDIKGNTRARAEVEHWWGDYDDADDNGLHRVGSARCFVQTSAPTTLSDTVSDFDSVAGTAQPNGETDLNDGASNSADAIEDDLGHGRCWIDTDGADGVDGNGDDNALYFYEGVAGDNNGAWVLAAGGSSNDDTILAGSANLVYNGSFEATDGTGLTAATAVPIGWVAISNSTFTYGTTADPDLRWGDGVYVIVTDVDGTDGMSILLENLAAGTTFKVLARVAEEDASDICTMTSTGASTDVVSTASAGVTWQTLSGFFITGAALDDVTLTFTNTAAGDICNWDHIAVYQQGDTTTDRDEISVPTMVFVTDSTTSTAVIANTTPADVPDLTVSLIPPQPNCIIEVDAVVGFDILTSEDEIGILCTLDENGTAKESRYFGGQQDGSTNGLWDTGSFHINSNYTNANPTPGTELVYTVECSDQMDGAVQGQEYDCDVATCRIKATMFCGGH